MQFFMCSWPSTGQREVCRLFPQKEGRLPGAVMTRGCWQDHSIPGLFHSSSLRNCIWAPACFPGKTHHRDSDSSCQTTLPTSPLLISRVPGFVPQQSALWWFPLYPRVTDTGFAGLANMRGFFKRVIKNLMSSGVRPMLNSASYTNLLCDPGQLAL